MITTKKISEISSNTFFYIPDYQRGYKWTNLQVEQLLSDIIQFEKSSVNNLNHSYCLQPIVLKKMSQDDPRLKKDRGVELGDDSIIYELIDGQQRLTTIFLILSFLNNRFKPEFATEKFKLFYETRERSYSFIEKLGEKGIGDELKEESKENIDFHHIYQSLQCITDYFISSEEKRDVNLFESTLRFRTKFIWYEVDEDENSTAKEIFKRLNSGKVELTNAELVKALFLGKFTSTDTTDEQRAQMAIEWEWIESKLNDDEFWYFLTNKKSQKNNRISFLLDHFADKISSEQYSKTDKRFTFLVFNELFQEKDKVMSTWEDLKHEFRLLHNWYSDFELFHFIGFLLSSYVGQNLNQIFELYEKSSGSIEQFKLELLSKIDEEVNCENIDTLHYLYDSYLIRKILLWFNISVLTKDAQKNQRFKFFKFKDLSFDLEHIKSQDSEITKSPRSQREFLETFFEFYAKQRFDETKSIDELQENEHEHILSLVYDYLIDSSDKEFSQILQEIKNAFDIDDQDFEGSEDHTIGNLCLLDQGTNRGYRNAIFPLKRQTIIKNDLSGVYILPMTKSAFLKQFSNTTKNLLVWTKADSRSHMDEIKKQIQR
jgi:uncharacterized protein with ParB-like and HNH nuclease domain